jgi:hypothetical protein
MNRLVRTAWRLFPFKSAARRFFRSPAAPRHWLPEVRACRIIAFRYGHLRTIVRNECLDAEGRPIPWYTYPALEFIRQLDFTRCSVFEYGSGNSTLFWSNVAARVVSVEHEKTWFERMRTVAPANCEMVFADDPDTYVNCLRTRAGNFDVIVIDGQCRLQCASVAGAALRPGGVIVLDNSDWFPNTAAALRGHDLIEVDMSGLGPINACTWTTSFFFHRSFAVPPRYGRQPLSPVGARLNVFDEGWWQPSPPGLGARPT